MDHPDASELLEKQSLQGVFKKSYFFYLNLSNQAITPRAQSYLSYPEICSGWPDKLLKNTHIPGQNSLFYGVQADSKYICKHYQCVTWKPKKLQMIVAM